MRHGQVSRARARGTIVVILTVPRCPPAVWSAPWSTTSPCSSRCRLLRTSTGAGTWTFDLRRRDRIPPFRRRNRRLLVRIIVIIIIIVNYRRINQSVTIAL